MRSLLRSFAADGNRRGYRSLAGDPWTKRAHAESNVAWPDWQQLRIRDLLRTEIEQRRASLLNLQDDGYWREDTALFVDGLDAKCIQGEPPGCRKNDRFIAR
jgi:hypothetical protein